MTQTSRGRSDTTDDSSGSPASHETGGSPATSTPTSAPTATSTTADRSPTADRSRGNGSSAFQLPGGGHASPWGDRLFGGAAIGSGLIVVVLVTLIGIFLLAQAIPAIAADSDNFLTSRNWDLGQPLRYGILQLLWTTVTTSAVALVFAVPLAIGIALFLTQYSPKWLAAPAATLVDLLAAVPSIVYGLWGAYIVAPKWAPIQDAIEGGLGWIPLFAPANGITSGNTIFFAGIVLAIMILPIITAIAREVFAQTPLTHKEAALALGATKWEMIRTTVLPFGRPGVISASMLGLGRALGETIAVLMILSSLPNGTDWSWSLFNGGQTFASKIASDASEFTGGLSTGAYIAAGLVLFVLTFVVNAIARIIIERQARN